MRIIILIFALLAILASFYLGQKANQVPAFVPVEEEQPFRVPVISNLIEGDHPLFKANTITSAEGIILGKYPVGDTTQILEDYLDYIDYESYGIYESPFTDPTGLQVFVDYETTIPESMIEEFKYSEGGSYFPIYLVNETHSAKSIFPQYYIDALLIAAKNDHQSYPITSNIHHWCGTGKQVLRICPDEMVVVAMPKFEGTHKTDMIVRLRIGNDILHSAKFQATVNPNQFRLDTSMHAYDDFIQELKENPFYISNAYFSGLLPALHYEE